jgi:hypothetical protein
MIDREKVLTLLHKRFPGARLCDLAAAANAIVGLDPEFDPLAGEEVVRFHCDVGSDHYTTRDVVNGTLRIYRRRPTGEGPI